MVSSTQSPPPAIILIRLGYQAGGELDIAFDVVVAVTCSQTIHFTSLLLGGVLCE